jgi:hypothetical protein
MRGGDYSSWARLARVKGEGETRASLFVPAEAGTYKTRGHRSLWWDVELKRGPTRVGARWWRVVGEPYGPRAELALSLGCEAGPKRGFLFWGGAIML